MGLNSGAIVACTLGATALGVTALSASFVAPAFRRVCIPYVPASDRQVANVRALLERAQRAAPIAPLVDLGSGDGRIVSLQACAFNCRRARGGSSSSDSGAQRRAAAAVAAGKRAAA